MSHKKLSIKSWSEDDRPREKLISKGAKSLSNAELIAIYLSVLEIINNQT
jgi:DNA repair protein RadC